MPYRFSATTGNIVRPIEAICLNTSTGALNYPMRYQSGSIPMWNGVIEFYSTFTRYWPTTLFSGSGAYSNSQYAYDEQDANSGTPITTSQHISYYTTYATTSSNNQLTPGILIYRITVPRNTSLNIKLIWSALTTGDTLSWGDCYADCGDGAYVQYQYEEYTGSVDIDYSFDNNIYYPFDYYTGLSGSGGTLSKKVSSLQLMSSSTSDYIYIRIRTSGINTSMVDPCSGQWCGGQQWLYANADATAYIYAVCVETV